jgi:hypothetical protein
MAGICRRLCRRHILPRGSPWFVSAFDGAVGCRQVKIIADGRTDAVGIYAYADGFPMPTV